VVVVVVVVVVDVQVNFVHYLIEIQHFKDKMLRRLILPLPCVNREEEGYFDMPVFYLRTKQQLFSETFSS
jgi:hypothetical protein